MTEGPFHHIEGNVPDKMMSGEEPGCSIDVPAPCSVVIFGASGDLTRRKIIPSLYRLFTSNLLPGPFFVIGAARSPMSDSDFRNSMKEAVKSESKDFSESSWQTFSEMLYYTARGV